MAVEVSSHDGAGIEPQAQLARETQQAAADVRSSAHALEAIASRLAPSGGPQEKGEDDLPASFCAAVTAIVECAQGGGTVLVSGLGKSGLIGAKFSATLASLGIPSHSVHPSEAAHGDLGRFRPHDVVIALSHSGHTAEVVNLAALLRQDGLTIISMTGGRHVDEPSPLVRLATIRLRLGELTEAGGEHLAAPTTSTAAALVLGDAIALAAARRMNFTTADFAKRHPGGSLGGLLRPVTDLLRFRVGANAPVAHDDASVAQALAEAEKVARRPGALLLIDAQGKLSGIFTDGDLRRLVLRGDSLDQPIRNVMTSHPRSLPETALGRDAVALIREHRADEIPIVRADGTPAGLLDVQDLVSARLVSERP